MLQHCLERGYDVVGVCREKRAGKLDLFRERSTIVSGVTDDREVIKKAIAGFQAPSALAHATGK